MARKDAAKSARKINPAVGVAAQAAFGKDGQPKPAVRSALLKAVEVQRPLVLANLRRLRKFHPNASPQELAKILEREFLSGVSIGGAAIGATAIMPGIGTVAALSISAAATGVFLEATALYAQSMAELHGIRLADPERAQLAVMAIVLGDEGASMLAGLSGHAMGNGKTPMKAWGSTVSKSMPMSLVKSIGGNMQKRFLQKIAVQGSASILGKALPFGIGAVVGGTGNLMMGRAVIASTHRAFGQLPVQFPPELLRELESKKSKKNQPLIANPLDIVASDLRHDAIEVRNENRPQPPQDGAISGEITQPYTENGQQQ